MYKISYSNYFLNYIKLSVKTTVQYGNGSNMHGNTFILSSILVQRYFSTKNFLHKGSILHKGFSFGKVKNIKSKKLKKNLGIKEIRKETCYTTWVRIGVTVIVKIKRKGYLIKKKYYKKGKKKQIQWKIERKRS